MKKLLFIFLLMPIFSFSQWEKIQMPSGTYGAFSNIEKKYYVALLKTGATMKDGITEMPMMTANIDTEGEVLQVTMEFHFSYVILTKETYFFRIDEKGFLLNPNAWDKTLLYNLLNCNNLAIKVHVGNVIEEYNYNMKGAKLAYNSL